MTELDAMTTLREWLDEQIVRKREDMMRQPYPPDLYTTGAHKAFCDVRDFLHKHANHSSQITSDTKEVTSS